MPPSDPDWAGFGIHPNKAFHPVGDPNRWGAATTVVIPAGAGAIESDQFLKVRTLDPYSRSWSIVGTLNMLETTWNDELAGLNRPVITLEAYLGVGQTSLVHRIVLAGPVLLGVPMGLCIQQNFRFGGPYQEIEDSVPVPNTRQTWMFAAIGALIGNSLAIKVRATPGAGFAVDTSYIVQAIVTPYAAGQGL